MSGWIALSFLDNPNLALKHFKKFYENVGYPISLSRGAYWLGRTYEKLGNTNISNKLVSKEDYSSTINTAAQNKINAQNALNAFNMNQRAMSFLWQELRDQADYAFRSADNYEQRKSAMYIAMLGNESGNYEGGTWEEFATGAKSSVFV